jgi:hypothetical protein
MYSSMSNGSRKPPGRLRILENVSKSTAWRQRCSESGESGCGRRSSGEFLGTRTVCANTALEIANLSERRVLATCAQQVAERRAVDAPVAALVEELESLTVVGRSLITVIHAVLVLCLKSEVSRSRVRLCCQGRERRSGVCEVVTQSEAKGSLFVSPLP